MKAFTLATSTDSDSDSESNNNNNNDDNSENSAGVKSLPFQSLPEPPKVISDIFEAVAGAILLDSGCDMELLWKIYGPLMLPFLDSHVTPQTVSCNPVRLFHELVSACKHVSVQTR